MPHTNGCQQVENHHHATVTEDGRTGDPVHPGKLRAQALDHDLARTGQAVHLHRHGMLAGAHQDHRQRQALAYQLGLLTVVQQVAQVLQLVSLAGVLEARCIGRVISLQLERRNPHDTFDGVQRNGIQVFAGVHHQRTVDRHGERQADGEARALAEARLDAHRAAQLLDLRVHHVHADATPGNLRDLLGR